MTRMLAILLGSILGLSFGAVGTIHTAKHLPTASACPECLPPPLCNPSDPTCHQR
jgi:hypothetical protein